MAYTKQWIKVRRWIRLRGTSLLVGVFVIAVLALLGLAIFVLPTALVSARAVPDSARLLELRNSVRTTLLQAIGGLVLLAGASLTWRTLRLNKEGQITERFTRAIDQLGNDARLDVRLGGIYALERIARDSPKDHWPIMEVLTANLRARSTIALGDPDPKERAQGSTPAPVPTDTQAILTVLGRRDLANERPDQYLDLRQTYLGGANLYEAHLEGASLIQACLEETTSKAPTLKEPTLGKRI